MKQAVGAAVLLMAASTPAWAVTITVGVAANFENPLKDIIDAYYAANGTGDTINYTAASTGTLKAAIIAGGSSNGPYDLFLAANQAAPADLVTNYSSLVEGSAFNYANGQVVLWSNDGTVNISSGLPTNFYSLYGQVAIADPVAAPYGTAAWNILNASPYNIVSLPDSQVSVYSNIDNTFLAVNNNNKKIGFVAKSQVCTSSGGVETYSGSSHYTYSGTIAQDGVKIERTSRSGAQDTLLNNFVNFLRTDTNARAIVANYCYS